MCSSNSQLQLTSSKQILYTYTKAPTNRAKNTPIFLSHNIFMEIFKYVFVPHNVRVHASYYVWHQLLYHYYSHHDISTCSRFVGAISSLLCALCVWQLQNGVHSPIYGRVIYLVNTYGWRPYTRTTERQIGYMWKIVQIE